MRLGIKTGHGFFQDVSFLSGHLEVTLEFPDAGFLLGQCGFALPSERRATLGVVLFVLAYPAVQGTRGDAEVAGGGFDVAVGLGEFDGVEFEFWGVGFAGGGHGGLVVILEA